MERYRLHSTNLSDALRHKVVEVLKLQGFKINPHVRPAGNCKRTYKRIQKLAKNEQISKYNNFLKQHFETVKSFCRNGIDIPKEYNPAQYSEGCKGTWQIDFGDLQNIRNILDKVGMLEIIKD
jgi:hypothetical protein